MADSGALGSYAYVLPQSNVSLEEAMQSAINRKDEQARYSEQRDYQRQQQQSQQDKANRLYNLKEIDADTDPSKYLTGEQKFDAYTQSDLAKIRDNALQNYVKLDPAEMEYRLTKDMQDLIQWHTAGKNVIKSASESLKEFNKTYPNVNATKAHDYVYGNMLNDFLETDPTGQVKRKSTELIKPRDYVADLNKPEVLATMVDDVTPFEDYFSGQKTSNVGEKEYVNNKGKVVSYKWSGAETPYSERITAPDGKVTGYRMKGQDSPIKDVRMFADEDYAGLQQNPKVWAAANALWQKEKERKGLNLKGTDEEIMKNVFLHQKASQFLRHGFKTEEIEKTPVTKITVNAGGGGRGGSGSGFELNDVYGEIVEKSKSKTYHIPLKELTGTAQGIVLKYARDLTGRDDLSQKNILIRKGDDEQLFIAKKNTDGSYTDLAPLDYKSINIKAQPSVKEKRAVISNAPKTPTPKPTASPANKWGKYKRS